jgi:hypothetical protein
MDRPARGAIRAEGFQPPAPELSAADASAAPSSRRAAMSFSSPDRTSISAANGEHHALFQPRAGLLDRLQEGHDNWRSRPRCRRRPPSGWFMSVISAEVRHARAIRHLDQRAGQRLRASSAASAMKAPLPTFTSSTSDCSPAASFFDRMEAVINGTESTVAVTSRMA